ncbi:hypothetical protein DFH01_02495 [Falsiroseomonas bella]|uniref:Peptidase S8/S53 domain-containing protein n=1 Tax=Falsiroseomonas bella TaxID=2184016 RepID=A0A317FJR3_9PROT|nr:S8 family serine peptidase [Falsiroseomonas bella]PWS38189.1 hypothetical protein DFH01_02495 [Falsiroseomonas bella]
MRDPRRIAALLVALLLLALPAGAPRADDDDDGGGPGGGGASSSAGGAQGGASDGGGGDPATPMPRGAPSTGDPLRDLRSFLGVFVPGVTPAPAPTAPAPAPAPRQAARPPAQAATTVPREIAAIGVDAPARARLVAVGFTVIEETPALLVPGSIMRLGPPRGSTPAAAAATARSLAPAARFDLNHLYRPGSAAPGMAAPAAASGGPAPARCAALPVGMIDTAIAAEHPALAGSRIERLTRRGSGRAPSDAAHGTAVAALLGAALGDVPIVAVDAFHRRPDGDAADAFDIAGALALLVARGVAVVNLSFAGPDNAVLALATERAAAQGLLLAAAAGNDGQQSPPRYPAAYPWVVAVTAVDRARRPFVRAVRGPHLAFAAPGVGLAAPGRAGVRLSGTSYAVPFVSAAFAWAMAGQDRDAALQLLAAGAEDLGSPGRDRIFGWGLIRPAQGCDAPRLDAAW